MGQKQVEEAIRGAQLVLNADRRTGMMPPKDRRFILTQAWKAGTGDVEVLGTSSKELSDLVQAFRAREAAETTTISIGPQRLSQEELRELRADTQWLKKPF